MEETLFKVTVRAPVQTPVVYVVAASFDEAAEKATCHDLRDLEEVTNGGVQSIERIGLAEHMLVR